MFDRNYVVEIPSRSDWIGNNVELKDDIICYIQTAQEWSRENLQEQVSSMRHTTSTTFPIGKTNNCLLG